MCNVQCTVTSNPNISRTIWPLRLAKSIVNTALNHRPDRQRISAIRYVLFIHNSKCLEWTRPIKIPIWAPYFTTITIIRLLPCSDISRRRDKLPNGPFNVYLHKIWTTGDSLDTWSCKWSKSWSLFKWNFRNYRLVIPRAPSWFSWNAFSKRYTLSPVLVCCLKCFLFRA